MADLKAIVDALPESKVSPTPTAVEKAVEHEMAQDVVGKIVDRLATPWVYGTAWHRFAKDLGVSIGDIARVHEVWVQRKAEIDSAKVEEPMKVSK